METCQNCEMTMGSNHKSKQNAGPHPSRAADAHIPALERNSQNVIIPTPAEIISLLSKRVIGQEQAKQVIAVAAYQHFLNCARVDLHGCRMEPENNVLLVGPTGSGKSMLLKSLAEILRCPVIFNSCANITPDGYKGKNLVQHLDSIASVIVDDEITRPAIIVWDEADKLAIQGKCDLAESANIHRRMTQSEFLVYLDGTKCGSNGNLDSSRILNIAIGAFVGLDEIRNPEAKPSVGFHQVVADQQAASSQNLVTAEHLITYGLIPEFVGRFTRISSLEKLDHHALRRILTEAEGNVLSRRKDFYALHGVRLEITDDAIDQLIQSARDEGTGGRALRVVVDRMLRQIEHRLPDMAQEGIHTLIYNRAAVLGTSRPIELRGNPANPTELIELRRHAAYSKQNSSNQSDVAQALGM